MKTSDASNILPKIRRIGEGLTYKSVENLKWKTKDPLTPVIKLPSGKSKLVPDTWDWTFIKFKDNHSTSPLLTVLSESLNKKLNISKLAKKTPTVKRNPIHIIGQKFVETVYNLPKVIIKKSEGKKFSLKPEIMRKLRKSDKKIKNPQKSCQNLKKPIKPDSNLIDSSSSGVSISAWD